MCEDTPRSVSQSAAQWEGWVISHVKRKSGCNGGKKSLDFANSTRTAMLEPRHLFLPKAAIPPLFPDLPAYARPLIHSLSSSQVIRIRRHLSRAQSHYWFTQRRSDHKTHPEDCSQNSPPTYGILFDFCDRSFQHPLLQRELRVNPVNLPVLRKTARVPGQLHPGVCGHFHSVQSPRVRG